MSNAHLLIGTQVFIGFFECEDCGDERETLLRARHAHWTDAAVRQLRGAAPHREIVPLRKTEKEVADTKKESALLRVLLEESEQSLYLSTSLLPSPLPSPLVAFPLPVSSFYFFLICYKDGNQKRLSRGTKERGGCSEVR